MFSWLIRHRAGGAIFRTRVFCRRLMCLTEPLALIWGRAEGLRRNLGVCHGINSQPIG